MGQRLAVQTAAAATGKLFLNIGVAEHKVLDQTSVAQGLDCVRFHHIASDAGNQLGVATFGKTELPACHRECRRENALVDDAQRSRGACDAVEFGRLWREGSWPVRPDQNLDVLFQRESLVLTDETMHRHFAQTADKHRLVLRQHFDVEKIATLVHGDEQIDRHAGEPRHRCQIDRFKNIANQLISTFFLLKVGLEDGPDRHLRVHLTNDVGRRKTLAQLRTRHDAGQCA